METTASLPLTSPQPISAPRIPARIRRIARALLLSMVALLATGTLYQSAAAWHDERANPPPGQLVDIGGYRLHIHCTGPVTGAPTLILDHGGGGFGAADWAIVAPELAKLARVCAYDRAGYGYSDPSPRPRTVDHETDELHALLERAGIAGPYVLVADSLGAYTLRMFATRYPEQVSGMVLIDGSDETEWSVPEIREYNQQFGLYTALCRATTPIGLYRALGETGVLEHPLLGYVPEDLAARARPLTYRPAYCRTIHEETSLARLEASAEMLRASRRPLGDLPIIVLTAGSGYPSEGYRRGWLAAQADLRSLSTRAEQRIADSATHVSLLTDQSQVVVEAVRDVLRRIEER